jgi:hypothetical protein
MRNHAWSHKLGQVDTIGVLLTLLSSFIFSHAAADIRPIPDAGITEKTVILLPNHAFYRVRIDGVSGGTQRAPFGSGGGCPLQTTVKSYWPVGTRIALNKTFSLPAGASNLRVLLSVDNDVRVFLNGYDLTGGKVIHDDCPLVDEFLFVAPDSILIEGTNHLVIRATDRGVESYLDLRVLVDVP